MMNERRRSEPVKPAAGYITALFFLFFSAGAVAQTSEVLCNDGVDNDGDGLVDCNDGDCQFAANIEQGCNCYDGVDNDGDGRADQADSNCAAYYGLTFVGEGSDCSITPPGASTPFDLVGAPIVSGQNTADTQSKVAIGDIDNDGIPDALITSKWNNEIRVVATTNGQADGSSAGDIKADYNLSGKKSMFQGKGCDKVDRLLFEHEVLTADIDGDGKSEIFAIASNRQGNPSSPPTCFFLMAFEYNPGNGGLTPLYDPVYLGTNRPGTFGIADMDGDGLAEIYLRDRIFAAETGALLASDGGKTMDDTGLWDVNVTAAPVAVDIKSAGNDGGKLELIVGPKIYQLPDLSNRNPASPGTLTLWRDMNTLSFDVNGDGAADQYYVKLMNDPVEYGIDTHSATSVADVDKDGYMDIVLTGALNSSVGRTTVFYWNVQKNTVSGYMTDTSADLGIPPGDPNYTSYQNGWIWGTGRVNIGDANGDGKLDFSFVAGNQLYCVTTDAPGTNIIDLWAAPRTINDSRSGVLTVTIYDFDNDGNPEMVYRDSQEVVVIDGATGTNKYWSSICQSHTYTEGPVIADMNGDGATDIGVTCNRSNSFNISDPIQQQALGEIRMYYSSGNEWLPTRQVWNQPGYHVVNVNDDLTLPYPQLDGALVFSDGACANGLPGPQTPLNVFLNQVPFLSADGCPVFPAPDLEFVGDDPENLPFPPGDPRNFPAVIVIPPICGNLDIQVSFNFVNSGDLPITDVIPVSFFHGDPTDPSVTADSLLFSTTITVNNLQVGDTITTAPVVFNGPGTPFRLYVVLNNDGSVLPVDPAGSVSNECRIDNNIYDVLVTPDPFTAVIEKIRDNEKCVAADPNVGELRARIYKGDPSDPANEVTDFSEYAFQWYYGTDTTNPVPAANGGNNYNLTDLAEGDYALVVTNTTKGCTTALVDTTVLLNIVLPAVSVNVLSHQTICSPPNGALEAVVAGGNTGYSFEWFSNAISLGVTTSTATNLRGDNYTVVVSRNGCTTTASQVVNDEAIEPDASATATPVENCQNPDSGSVTAEALVGGVVQDPAGFTFDWYFHDEATATRGSVLPPAHGTGPARTGLPVGFYELEITNNATQCKSLPFIIEVTDNTVVPEVTITELAPQTSCDPVNPNGQLQAVVSLAGVQQDPAGFTFEWFVGQNTLPANLHTDVSGINGSIAEKVKGGGQSYTVKVTTPLQCSAVTDTVVSETINYPVVTLATTPNSICDPALAAGNFTGSVTPTVTFAGNPVVDFTDYSFTWYDGTLASGTPRAETSASLSPVTHGYYTLVVTRTDLGCASTPKSAEVENITVLPVITANGIASTNCDPLLANGQALVTDVDGAGTGAPYDFKWYEGSTVSGAEIALTAATPDTLQGASGKFYTVLVTNQNSGCQNTATVEVPDNSVLPLLSLTATPNSICDPALTVPSVNYNGSVTATITNQGTNPVGDYVFTWTDEETATAIAGATGPALTERDSSYYTGITVHTPTGCTSDPVTIQITPALLLPAITTTVTSSTNCDPALANGSVTVTDVDGAGTGAPYSFQWHDGMDLSSPISGATGVQLGSLQGSPGEFYTVLVTNENTGCRNTSVNEVLDAPVLPVLALTPSPNSICDPALTAPAAPYNGSVAAAITNQGGNPLSDYVFTWTDEETGTAIAGVTGQNLLNRDSSFYTAVVRHIPTGCVSDSVTAEVTEDFQLPVISATGIPSTNCDPALPNGQGVVNTVDGIVQPAGAFTFQWHDGTDTTTPVSGETNYNLLNRQGGPGEFYTVLVVNQADGCRNTFTVEIPDDRSLPMVTLASTDNTICAGTPDGTASLSTLTYKGGAVVSPYTGYSFNWSNGATTAAVSQQPAGTYTLVVTKDDVGCDSDPVEIDIKDALVYPAIVLTPTPQTSCDTNNPNGQIVAGVDEGGSTVTAGYTFSWFEGNGTATPLPPARVDPVNTFTAVDLPGNVAYTVRVTNDATSCENTRSMLLQEIIAIPRIELVVTDVVDCNNPGSITANVFIDLDNDGTEDVLPPADYGDYEFSWFIGSNTASPQLVNTTGRLLEFLDDGVTTLPVNNYTAFVTNTLTSCVSPDVTDMVNGPPPLFDIDYNVNFRPASCAADEGVITAYVNDGGTPTVAGYTFEWYEGAITNGLQTPPPSFYTDPPVSFNGSPLDVDALGFYGSASYPAGQALPAHQAPTGTATGPTLYGKASGTYTVVATRDADGCKEYLTAYLPYQSEPIIIVAEIVPDDCLGDNGAVSVDITVPGASTPDQYKIWLIDGVNPTLVPATDPSPFKAVIDPAAATGNAFTSLGPGIYTVVAQEDIIDISSGCFSTPVQIEMREALPPLLDMTAAAFSTSCGVSPGDGSLEITITTDPSDPFHPSYPPPPPPVSYTTTPPTYTLEAEDDTNNSVFSNTGYAGGSVVPIPGLQNGNYDVTVTSSYGCTTTKTFAVPWNPQVAELVDGDVIKADALYCDPLLEANARVEVTSLAIIGGAADDIGDYRFDWYTDIDLTANVYSDTGDPTATPAGEVFENNVNGVAAGTVVAGSYWVVATKVNAGATGGVGCTSAPFKVTLEDNSTKPTPALTPFTNTACDIAFEGAIEVRVTDPGSVPTPDYTYTWDAANPVAIANTASNDGDGDGTDGDGDNPQDLGDGTYRLTITNNASGCVTPGQTTILKSATPIIVASATPVHQVICNPDGSITVVNVTVGGAVDANHANFDFTWYRDNPNSAPIINAANGEDVLDINNYPTIGAGVYYVKAKRTPGINPGSGCESAPLRVDINDQSSDPVFTLTPTGNTACDTNYDGSIQLTVTDPGSVPTATYTYDWDAANPIDIEGGLGPVAGNDGDGDGTDGDGDNPQNLRDGTYLVTVINDASGCRSTSGQVTVMKISVPIIVTSATTADQVICDPDGSITVVDVTVDGVTDPVHTNFDFTWYQDDTNGTPIIDAVNAADVLDDTNYPAIGAGTYFVKAKRAPGISAGSGCESVPLKVDLYDLSRDPVFTLAPFANTACDMAYEGRIALTVTDPGSAPTATYTYDWDAANPTDIEGGLGPVAGNDGDGDGTDGDGDNPQDLGDGLYRVTVINDVSGCRTTGQTTIMKNTVPIIVTEATPVDQMICNPDGSITVVNVSVGGVVDPVHTNFDFSWYIDSPDNAPIINEANGEDVLDINNYPTMGAGTYYVKAKRAPGVNPGSGCESAPLRVDIKDLSVDPELAFSFEPNTSCNPMNPNGTVLATASERDGTTDAYTFAWLLNNAALPGVTTQTDASPESELANAFEGDYVLTITNTLTGCTFMQGLAVNLDLAMSLPNIVEVSAVNPVNCFPTGSARVVEITIGGTTTVTDPVQLDAGFDYEWYKNDYPANVLAGEVNAALLNQEPDRYFVLVEDLSTNCKSSPVEVVIDSADIVYPVVKIMQTVPQISCDPLVGTAVLVSTADDQDDTNPAYNFTWYPSLDLTGASFATTSTIADLAAGDYSVDVYNTATNCSASAFYIVPDHSPRFLPQLSLSTSARTRCDAEDGSLLASGVPFPADPGQPLNNYPFPYNYSAELYTGDPPADLNNPEYGFMANDPNFPAYTSNFLQTGLPEGPYTVRLTDLNTGCVTIDAVAIGDARMYPVVMIVEDNPLINCDPARPNGQLSATADGGKVGGYSFQWFAGTAATGSVLSSNNKLIGQTMGSYTVLVTNNTTGCPGEQTGSISDGTMLPPVPTAVLIQERTSCLMPNGWVAANVGGVTLTYTFNWYDGTTAQGSPDFTGVNYTDRDVGPYAVTATDIATGCVSPPAVVEVPDGRVIPEAELMSTPSYCQHPTGTVTLEVVTPDVVLTDIQWYDDNSDINIGNGPAAYELPAGSYRAEFTSSEGCVNEGVVEVSVEILSYNLVSANGDNSNDVWIIDCIQNFPSNNVKVFNRSGVKVYEADGYNNLDIIFRGIGEKGVYALGNDLPDGTYFYIIDKRDGSRPITGYLELVR